MIHLFIADLSYFVLDPKEHIRLLATIHFISKCICLVGKHYMNAMHLFMGVVCKSAATPLPLQRLFTRTDSF